jgi:predicted Zn-dependent peptidase
LENWSRFELDRIKQAMTQEIIGRAMDALRRQWEEPDPVARLFALVLKESGHASYGLKNIDDLADVSADGLSRLVEQYVRADRITIALVGDIEESAARQALEASFGRLEPSSTPTQTPMLVEQEENLPILPPEERRIEIASEVATEVLVAWPIPHSSLENRQVLSLFAEILVGSQDSRLISRLVKDLGCSEDIQTIVALPEDGAAGLYIVRADVADGHRVEEVEQAIVGVIKDSVGVPLEYVEVMRAAQRMDARHSKRLADASGLARELISLLAGTGDWSHALIQPSLDINLDEEQLMPVLQSFFQPTLSYSAMVEQDPIRSPRSPQHARVASLLAKMLERKGQDPLQMEDEIKETLRQFGLMPDDMRSQFLSLLAAEAAR